MVSRKKAKGKARRAAKEAKSAEEEEKMKSTETKGVINELSERMQQLQLNRETMGSGDNDNAAKCTHGVDLFHDDVAICVELMDRFEEVYCDSIYVKCQPRSESFSAAIDATYEKYSAVWDDPAKLGRVVSLFVAEGTQNILDGNIRASRGMATLACFLELYVEVRSLKSQSKMAWQRMAELGTADINTLVSFLRKRIPCKCLDKKYKEVKATPKMGVCCNAECSLPDMKVERSKMMYCTGCSKVAYCSPECQQAAWPKHRVLCKKDRDVIR